MNLAKLTTLPVIALISACATVTATPPPEAVANDVYVPINTEQEYRSQVVGKLIKLTSNNTTTITYANGRMTGRANGTPVRGKWTWENGLFCREGIAGDVKIERDCQKLEISGNKLKVTRKGGRGSISIFELG